MSSVDAITRRGLLLLSPLSDGSGQIFKHIDCRLPIDACICDRNALLETGWALGRDFLCAFVDVGLDHDTDNSVLTFADLLCDDAGDLWLVAVVLERVA